MPQQRRGNWLLGQVCCCGSAASQLLDGLAGGLLRGCACCCGKWTAGTAITTALTVYTLGSCKAAAAMEDAQPGTAECLPPLRCSFRSGDGAGGAIQGGSVGEEGRVVCA